MLGTWCMGSGSGGYPGQEVWQRLCIRLCCKCCFAKASHNVSVILVRTRLHSEPPIATARLPLNRLQTSKKFFEGIKGSPRCFKVEGENPKPQGPKAFRLLARCLFSSRLGIVVSGTKTQGLRRGSWMPGPNHAGLETLNILRKILLPNHHSTKPHGPQTQNHSRPHAECGSRWLHTAPECSVYRQNRAQAGPGVSIRTR